VNNREDSASTYRIDLPSDLDYVSPLRHFISDMARIEGYPKKFCFRTEILVDELATNAILHGPGEPNSEIQVQAVFHPDRMDVSVQDRGGTPEKLDVLRKTIYSPRPVRNETRGRGLVIVQMLSDELKLNMTDNGHTQIRVTKLREDETTEDGRNPVFESIP
jgi:anti-sigma regulatory factor (Ser/Thr protein kinase)